MVAFTPDAPDRNSQTRDFRIMEVKNLLCLLERVTKFRYSDKLFSILSSAHVGYITCIPIPNPNPNPIEALWRQFNSRNLISVRNPKPK